MPTWSISGRAPDEYLNLNDNDNRWRKADKVKQWRTAGWAFANARRPKPDITGVATVTLFIGTDRPNTRRDPSNWTATTKALVDGLTDAGLWPDDNSKHVTIAEPRFVANLPAHHFELQITWEEPNA